MTHPIASYFIAVLNIFFLAFVYYHAKVNFVGVKLYTVLVGLLLIFLARGSFAGTPYRSKKEKGLFYTLLAANLALVALLGYEWYRV